MSSPFATLLFSLSSMLYRRGLWMMFAVAINTSLALSSLLVSCEVP